MKRRLALGGVVLALAACSAPPPETPPAGPDAAGPPAAVDVPSGPEQFVDPGAGQGTIVGRIHLAGRAPGNRVIRMGLDPACVEATRDELVIQEEVMTSEDGGLANVFVRLEGRFPETSVPSVPADPVEVEQRGCVYRPRVVGVRVGQTLGVRNSDDILHNVHSYSAGPNGFNISQPRAGMVHQAQLAEESGMVELKCDLHRWMIVYVGVVSHPYFDVTGGDGRFRIEHVPAGARTIQIWHERYGTQSLAVEVEDGVETTVELTYGGGD